MDAEEIRRRDFSRRFRGFDPTQVRSALEQAAEAIVQADREVEGLRREVEDLKRQLKEHHDRQQSLETALGEARRLSESVKVNAEREAQLLVAEAELQAEKTLGQAHNRLAQIHDDIAELKRQRAQFEVRLRSLVEAHLKLMDVERDRDRELAELEDKVKILRAPA
jgi:cell division initiation protein